MFYCAYVGYNGEDYWDVVTGHDRATVEADAARSAARCEKVEGYRPGVEVREFALD